MPEAPPLGPVVINPGAPSPQFNLRDGRFVPIADVKAALDQKKRIVIIDARASSDWMAMRIPGSITIPYYLFDRLDAMPRDGTWITAYCACPHHASGAVVDELRKRGFKNTAVLDEGILEWKKRGYPIEGSAPPQVPGAPPIDPTTLTVPPLRTAAPSVRVAPPTYQLLPVVPRPKP
jgi:rhodanese-related sulfurtransferase